MKLITDTDFNAYIYDREKCCYPPYKLNFHRVFDYLTKLKNEFTEDDIMEQSLLKIVKNSLWGSLCEAFRHVKKIDTSESNKEIVNIEGVLNSVTICEKEKIEYVKYMKYDKYYKTNFARLKPFLLSKIRLLMYKLIDDLLKNNCEIIRVHTDGIHWIGDYIPDIKINDNYSGYKYKKYENYTV